MSDEPRNTDELIDDTNEMSFLDHLEELRWRIIKTIIGVILGAVICGIYVDRLINDILIAPALNTVPPLTLINLKPYGQLVLYMEVILVGGIIASIPNVFYQFWKFIVPGLHSHEKKYVWWIVFFSTFCFLGGVAFGYFIMIPAALSFFAAFGTNSITNNIAVNEYLSFVLSVILTAGIVFELPMASYFLSKMGILTPKFMRKYRRHAIVIILLLAGILTPGPDITSQLLLGIPLFILYELSIIISKFAQKKKYI